MIKVAITDDQEIILNGLQKILAEAPDIFLTGAYTNGVDLLAGIEHEQPDVLLIDIFMPGQTGIELTSIISKKFPAIRIIALTNVDIIPQVKKMLQQGASGYLLKDAAPATIVDAIRRVYEGEKYLYADLQKQIMENLFDPKPNNHVITRREKEILALIVDEHTNQEIADKLYLSLRTVENHRNNLLQKLGVKNTAGLVKAAISQGLI